MRASIVLTAVAVLSNYALATITPYPNNTLTSTTTVTLSDACVSAMEADIDCNPYLATIANVDVYGAIESGNQTEICDASCGESLSSYRASVITACSDDAQAWQGYSHEYYSDYLWASYNLTCLTDSTTGAFCTDYIANLTSTITDDSGILSLPTDQACSPCVLAILQHVQGTSFSNYRTTMVDTWASLQEQCGVSYPTEVQTLTTNITNLPGFAPANYSYPTTCLSGNNYTVVSGDTCASIADANSVATGTLISINDIVPSCADLYIGQILCLPQTCDTYTTQSNDTCISISTAFNLTWTQVISYNPTINSGCTNLLSDVDICISPPGGVWNGTTVAGAIATQTAVYASATVTPPGSVGAGTTTSCGKYYQVQSGDYCELIALNNTITVALFEEINPSVDSGCTNLIVGLYYCVYPTADWNTTSNGTLTTSTYITAPTTTPTGTTSDCYEWYTVQTGDYCGLIESAYSITLDQLQALNPDLLSDCSNLILGDSYCVSGDVASTSSVSASATATLSATSISTSTSSSTGSASTTVAAPTTTPSGSSSACYQWYTIQSGDYCYLLETNFSITFTQLQTWNPSLDSDCSNLALGEAYCVQGPTT